MIKPSRSYIMSQIKSKNTKPEILIRKFLHSKGLRYRLHDKNLPGKPDLIFAKYKAVIFVHGCFWHGHSDKCKIAHVPKTRQEYWIPKIKKNIERFKNQEQKLHALGFKVITIWECDIKNEFNKITNEVIDQLIK